MRIAVWLFSRKQVSACTYRIMSQSTARSLPLGALLPTDASLAIIPYQWPHFSVITMYPVDELCVEICNFLQESRSFDHCLMHRIFDVGFADLHVLSHWLVTHDVMPTQLSFHFEGGFRLEIEFETDRTYFYRIHRLNRHGESYDVLFECKFITRCFSTNAPPPSVITKYKQKRFMCIQLRMSGYM